MLKRRDGMGCDDIAAGRGLAPTRERGHLPSLDFQLSCPKLPPTLPELTEYYIVLAVPVPLPATSDHKPARVSVIPYLSTLHLLPIN